MRLPLPFTSYQTRAPRAGVQRLVNCYAEKGQEKDEIILYGDPGVTTKVTLESSPQRGAIEFQGRLHVVAGTSLYKITKTGIATELATVPGTDNVQMSENGAQLVILAGLVGYVWDGSDLLPISDSDFRGATDCTFIDNYIILVEAESGRFFGSELGEATQYDSLDFATAESYPDDLVGVAADHGQLFLAGKRSCELWDNRGGSGFPFARNFNGVIEQGCGAGRSLVKADQTFMWIDDVGMARRLDDVTPVRISTHGVEQAWSAYETLEDAEGYSFVFDGHIWVVWNFPTAERTWIYDVTSQQWHEKASYNSGRWRVQWAMNIYGEVWCGDRLTGKVGIIDPDVFQEFGDTLPMSWTYPSVYAEKNTAFHRELEVVCETGVGNPSALSPEIMMECSDDGGRTFDFLPLRELGRMGDYRTIVTWTRLGSSEDRVYRGSISAPARRAVLATFLDVQQGVF